MFGKHCYTALDWYNIEGDRIVWKGLNRADHPDPSQPPLEFPSLQIIHYAACQAIDPDFPEQLSRRHWGDIDWARTPAGHAASPSWLGREREIPIVRRIEDMDFGERV